MLQNLALFADDPVGPAALDPAATIAAARPGEADISIGSIRAATIAAARPGEADISIGARSADSRRPSAADLTVESAAGCRRTDQADRAGRADSDGIAPPSLARAREGCE